MPLDWNVSTLTDDERLAECNKILEMFGNGTLDFSVMNDREKSFVAGMQGNKTCSPAQILWLRAIKDKYL
jgi:hypothetical protein